MRSTSPTFIVICVLALSCWWGFGASSSLRVLALGGQPSAQFVISPVNNTNQALTLNANSTLSVTALQNPPGSSQLWALGFQMVNNMPQQVVSTTGTSGTVYLAHHYDAATMTMSVSVTSSLSDETAWSCAATAAYRPSSTRIYTTSPSNPSYAFALMVDANDGVSLGKLNPGDGWGASNHSFDWTTTIFP